MTVKSVEKARRVSMSAVLCLVMLPFARYSPASDGIGGVRLKGYLGGRLDAMIERHVAGTDVDYITETFFEKAERKGWWQTEFWGKFMHAAVPYLEYAPTEKLRDSVERGLERVLSSQEASGYIGNYPDELRCGEGWDVWGMKYTMMGLLHHYDGERGTENGKRALEACRRLCDYVIGELGPGGKRGRELWQTGNWSGYASSSILEPVVWLYRRTRERKYLDFAAYIVKGMTEPASGPRLLDLALRGVSVADRNGHGNAADESGNYVMKHSRLKAYEMMSCYQGLLEYCEVAGRRDLLSAALATAEDIAGEEVNLAGGCAASERWFHGARKQHLPYASLQETCVTTTWMRFCEKLLDLTGETVWADRIERTFYNAYLAAMKADGSSFAAYTPLSGNRWSGMHHCYMHTDCCTANGPRGFLCFLRKFFRMKDGDAVFNFYASATVRGKRADGSPVSFEMYSLYPRSDHVRIVSRTEGRLAAKFRIPAWSAATSVKLNGEELAGVKAGTYFGIDREWRLGDIVEMRFEMPVVAHVLDHHVAFTRGPVLLARDSRFADGDMTEPFRSGTVGDGRRMDGFTAVRTPSEAMWMAFSATLPIGSHHENREAALPSTVFFCDFASAGNAWTRTNGYRTWFPVEYVFNE